MSDQTKGPQRIIAVVQARMGSSRLPGKVMAEVHGHPLVRYVLTRAARAATVDEVWLACSDAPADEPLAACGAALGFPVLRGPEEDVLSRFVAVASRSDAGIIVRLTADCPLIDPGIIDLAVRRFLEGDVDYVSNGLVRSWPDGLDVEVFSREALDAADREARDPFLRAHVTPYIHGRLKDRLPCGDFKRARIVNDTDFSHLRWTVDEPEDLELMRRLVPLLPEAFRWTDVLAVLTRHPDLLRINRGRPTNEGTIRDLAGRGEGDRARRRFDESNRHLARAEATIPLASQTFSKSHRQWVRGATPLFIDSGAGCRVTDIDGNDYLDYVQGLMANLLGHGDPDVDAAIRDQLERGTSFPLASTLEADLAERLVRDIPCADMARFGKNGSDATSAAIRLARAATGRDRVAICGYHGWHDWYIGTTSRHLGVPGAVRDLSATFPYNDADALAALLAADPEGYAAVILEPAGTVWPEPGFLERLRALTEQYGTLLVFDEIVTGFRLHPGGAQGYFGVTPDLAAFGKSMANGMPVSAVVGRRDLMMLMEEIFFSGTFGGETLSIAAAIATIDKLAREDGAARLWRRGEALTGASNAALDNAGLGGIVRFGGQGWWPRLRITDPPVDGALMTSLLRQEFVAAGLLLAAGYNLCLPHDNDAVMAETVAALGEAAARVRDHLDAADPAARLLGARVQPTFAVRP